MRQQRTTTSQVTFIPWRYYLLLASIAFLSLGLIIRVIDLTIFNQRFLQQQGNTRVLRLINTPAFRGMIMDRNGYPLAVSTLVYSIWMNPKEFAPTRSQLRHLATLLDYSLADLKIFIKRKQKSKREFVYLKRSLAPKRAQAIKSLAISGLYTQAEYRRYYPEGEVTAHLIGFTNVDDQGQEGLELAYNQWLQGEKGQKWVIKDRLGRIIDDVQTLKEQQRGHDLILSIDRRIQYLAYRALLEGVITHQAHAASAVVLDVQSGEILAMVNQPSFNPNLHDQPYTRAIRNRAVTDSFEPASTIKAFTIAMALESRKYQANAHIDTSPGWMRLDHHVVKDERNNGLLSLAQILQVSSNMGVARIVLSLPHERLWNVLHRFGFGEITGVGFPGEQAGSLIDHSPWGDFTLATLSFGYGLSVTPLQLARAYAILAHDGLKIPLSLLKTASVPQGQSVLAPKIAQQMLHLLETVVEKGSGKRAQIPGFRVAGKTGTAIKVGSTGYEKHHYTSVFVGVAPVSKPRLAVAVVIHDPQGKEYYGAQVAAPVFKNIMEAALRTLAIAPDGT